jgi:hypothetical protein
MTAGTSLTLAATFAYGNSETNGLQLPLKGLELGKVRIKHILRETAGITNDVVNAFSTYGAVAAVNSILSNGGPNTSLINLKAINTNTAYTAVSLTTIFSGDTTGQIGSGLVDGGGSAFYSITIPTYNPTTSTTTSTSYSLLSHYKNLPQTFGVITSKAYMLALTNNADAYTLGGTPAAAGQGGYIGLSFVIPQSGAGPNAPGDAIVYTYNASYNPATVHIAANPASILMSYPGSGWQDSFAPALQSYVNYLAALAISDSAQTAATGTTGGTGYTLDLAMFGHYQNYGTATGDPISSHIPTTWYAFQCIYGLRSTSLCQSGQLDGVNTVAPWVGADAKNFMLSLPYLAANTAFTGIDTTDIAAINTLYATYNTLASPTFDQLVGEPSTAGTPPFATYKDFFNVYSNLDITRAVTPYDYYTTFVTGGGALSTLGGGATNYVLPYTTQIFQSEPIMDMINKGIISFAQAFTDITAASPHPYVINPAFQMWGNQLPISIYTTTGGLLYPNTQIGAHANAALFPGGALTSPTAWNAIMSNPATGAANEHTWVSTFATRGNWATLLAEGDVTFQELESLPISGSSNGIYGPGGGDTEPNFLKYFGLAANLAESSYAMTYAMIKAGIPLNSFCAVATATSETTPFPCDVAYPSLAISTANSVPNSMTHLACATSREVLELLESEHAYYWQSPYLLLADVMTAVCA